MSAALTREDFERFDGQARAILERLARGPATNHELAAISLKYTGRLSDLRAGGHDIRAERMAGGVWEYRLLPSRAPVVEASGQVQLIPAGRP